MRRLTQSLERNNIDLGNLLSFPYDLLVPSFWDPNIFVFRFMVDSETGSDSNTGLSWDSPFKTIQAAINMLPRDLKNHNAYIFVHGGAYNEAVSIGNYHNGRIYLDWIGLHFNSDGPNTNFQVFARAGSDTIARSNDPIVINGDTLSALTVYGCSNLLLKIQSCNDQYGPTSAGYGYAERWVFTTNSGASCASIWSDPYSNTTFELFHAKFPLGGASTYGLEVNCNGFVVGGSFYPGSGGATTGSGKWRGAIALGCNDTQSFTMGSHGGSYGWAAGFEPPQNVHLYFEDIKQILTTNFNTNKYSFFNPTSMYYADISSGFLKGDIYVGSDANGVYIAYHEDYANLLDNSQNPRTYFEQKNSALTQYLLNSLKYLDSNLLLNLQSTPVADALLSQSDLQIYIDESSNKLMFKLKFSTGTVKSGEIPLL